MIPFARVNTIASKHAPPKTRPHPVPTMSQDAASHVVICGAKTRAGFPCRMPPVTGKTRCRMHGGTKPGSKRSGAPKGNTNAFVHGYYSATARAERKRLADQVRWLKNEMKEMRKLKGL